ncbi:hypothetical protein RCL1_003398 [Eukaryota sp. TZLM3-RCL]
MFLSVSGKSLGNVSASKLPLNNSSSLSQSRPISALPQARSSAKLRKSRPKSSAPRLETTSHSFVLKGVSKSNHLTNPRSLSPQEELAFQRVRSRVLSQPPPSATPPPDLPATTHLTPSSSPNPSTPVSSPSLSPPSIGPCITPPKTFISSPSLRFSHLSLDTSFDLSSSSSFATRELISDVVSTSLFSSFDVFESLLGSDEGQDPIETMLSKTRKCLAFRLES